MKIPKPGVDLFLPFFLIVSTSVFGVSGRELLFGPSSIYWAFSLSSYRASKCHIPNNPFFNITLPLPNHMDIFLNCFFDWCWVWGAICRWCDMVLFPYYISMLDPLLKRTKFECGLLDPFLILFSTHCLFFLLHFTVMINLSALNYCFPCAWWQIEDGMPDPVNDPQKAFKKSNQHSAKGVPDIWHKKGTLLDFVLCFLFCV